MGDYTEAWRSVHNLLAQFAAFAVLEPMLKKAADAEQFIEQHAGAEAEVAKLRQDIKALQAKARAIVSDAEREGAKNVSDTVQRITAMQKSFDEEQERAAGHATQEVQQRQQRLAALDGRIAEQEGLLNETIAKVNTARSEFADLEAQAEELRQRVRRL